MRHGSPRVDRVRGRFRNRLSERKHHTTGTSTRGGSGVLAGRCVLYPPHSTPLLLLAELAYSRIVGKPELIVRPKRVHAIWRWVALPSSRGLSRLRAN
jgi:hypothetical protein